MCVLPPAGRSEQCTDASEGGEAVPLLEVAGPWRPELRHGPPALPQASAPIPPRETWAHGYSLQVRSG